MFQKLSQSPETVDPHDFAIIEIFTVLAYDRSSSETSVDAGRRHLFAQKNRPYDSIRPTRAALFQHVQRSVYQAGFIWGQSLVPYMELPSPEDWGWRSGEDGNWVIHWSNNGPIAEVCKELKKCGCKTECSRRCSCKSSGLPCTSLCTCQCTP